MSIALPSSTNILCTLLLTTLAVITKVLIYGWCPHLVSTSVKTMSLKSRWVLLVWPSSVLCTCVWGGVLASFAYLLSALRLSPAICGPPIMVKTSLILSILYCLCRFSLLATWGSSKNSLKYPTLMSISISSLRAMHLSILCPISLWKA